MESMTYLYLCTKAAKNRIAPLTPHLSLPTAIAGKVFPSRKRPTMKCKTFRNNE